MSRIKKAFHEIDKVAIGVYNKMLGRNVQMANERLEICLDCDSCVPEPSEEFALIYDKMCSECLCNIGIAVYSPEKECPLNKW